jgi:hypothetical protein
LYEPLYSKRAEIVNGDLEVEPSKDEVPESNAASEEVGEEEKGVPQFWLTAMKTNEILAMQITERDEAALKYIKDIKWSNLDENKGFILEFYFDSNPYFKNPTVLPYHFSITLVVSIISSFFVGSFAMGLDVKMECHWQIDIKHSLVKHDCRSFSESQVSLFTRTSSKWT